MKLNVKRIVSGILSVIMITGNVSYGFSGITAYAANTPRQSGKELKISGKGQAADNEKVEESYINDMPIRLQVSKVKTAAGEHEGISPKNTPALQADTITYEISGRIDGSEAEIVGKYGVGQVELAYSLSGIYLGYGWVTGTLEYLQNRQAQQLHEEIQIIYNEYGVFDGYAYVTRRLETSDDINRYVAGGTMALYDAVEVFKNPAISGKNQYYGEDERFTGVTVIRDSGSGNVTSAYVNKGYAGNQVQYVLQKSDESKVLIDDHGTVINDNYSYQDEINDKGHGTWIAKTVQRGDTPILFYSLDNLRITSNDIYTSRHKDNEKLLDDAFGAWRTDQADRLFGFRKDGSVFDITQNDETDFSVYAFEAGSNRPVYEFYGGNYQKIRYSQPEKIIEVGEGTLMYHLDQDGNRDSLVDPQTGIAYVMESGTELETEAQSSDKIYVWPVNVFYDGSGGKSGSRTFQKIITTRIATIHADTPDEYTTGTYDGTGLLKSMNPVLDQYGHPVYYRQSKQTYQKGTDTYDYDGDEYTGYRYKDSLDRENENAYTVNDHQTLYNGDADDPFDQSTHYQYTDKQTVIITVDREGNFVVNGVLTVPTPSREGYQFAGWLMEPNQLSDGASVKAYWRNPNSPGMSETEKKKWYSSRTSEGPAVTLKITFDANGGTFKNGSGDIHSADNILYHKLGEAYLMENIWQTGENTPNDPFDQKRIDTVENTAENKDTISSTGRTGNDVYSNTSSGGQADMLKRVNAGSYIMEEVKAPSGYVKALPAGLTIKENLEVQTAELKDTTIKVEFIKKDAADSFEKELYIDGELQVNAAGITEKVAEPKGSYTYTHVSGAVLSLKARDKQTEKAFSDWVKVTENQEITKRQENGVYYLEFPADFPLFLEGIPAGNYILSEVVTPPGYITMADQPIVVTAAGGVQIFEMNDDHTKVEIEKYYNEEGQRKNLPNASRAQFSLLDQTGNVVAAWVTDDASDYIGRSSARPRQSFWNKVKNWFSPVETEQSFVTLFTDLVNSGDLNFSSISWKVTREAVKHPSSTQQREVWTISNGERYICENQKPPEDAPETFQEAYKNRNLEEASFTYQETISAVKEEAQSPNLANQIWSVSNGTVMHVSVNGDNDHSENGKQAYTVDFKFNYRNYSGSYKSVISYDTADGRHRFDYLPAGAYTVRETKAPDGYITAPDKVIVVEGTDGVQRFTVENKKRQLIIAKTAKMGENYYAGYDEAGAAVNKDPTHAAVVAGAELSLYYSERQIPGYENEFKEGVVPAGAVFADKWISGSDGIYTEADYLAELIRKDQIGDYKPHTVKDILNGWYYLVETKTPSYYKTMAAKEIHVTDQSSADKLFEIQAENTPIPLEVKVHKKNDEGRPLSGAVFLVQNQTLGGIDVGALTTDGSGKGSLIITDIGRFTPEGTLEPYTFTIREIQAPEGYQINHKVHEFKPSPEYHGITTIMSNEADSDIADGVLYVVDALTEIWISKADFQDGGMVPGTTLTLYEADNLSGRWASTGVTKEDWTWTTEENETAYQLRGLSAGKVYVLREEKVPAGYTKAEDIFFRISANGIGIDKIWYDPEEQGFISFQTDSMGAVERVTFSTRSLVGSHITLTDLLTGETQQKGVLSEGFLYLSSEDIADGRSYQIKEYATYSDHTSDCLSTTTFIGQLYQDWMKIELNKEPKELLMEVTDLSGKEILAFRPDNSGIHTVDNPLAEDPDCLTVVGSILLKTGVDHKAIKAGDQIRYQITCQGVGKEIVVLPAAGLSYLHTPEMEERLDGSYHMTTKKENNTITFIAKVKPDAAGFVDQHVSIDGKSYSYLNPVAVNHGEGIFTNSSKLVISNAVEGTHMGNENTAFRFRITLTKADGSPLAGAYDYRTKNTRGQLAAYGKESSFEITVYGNDFITVSDLPYNTEYNIVQLVSSDYPFTVTNTEASGKTSNTGVSNVLFTNNRNEASERTLFQKNKGYQLSEHLLFLDGSHSILRKYRFSFGEKCQVNNITVLNKPTEVWFSKQDWTDSEEVPGAVCSLLDESGEPVLDAFGNPVKWISGREPKKISGILEAGKKYRYHEELAPEGYSYSVDVAFQVSMDGTIDKVIMQDKPVIVYFSKEDFGGTELSGAYCELRIEAEPGELITIESWISGTTPHKIQGKLLPETIYYYHESAAPDGYSYSEDIRFRLDRYGKIVDACYVNENRQTLLYDKDGYVTEIVVKEEGGEKSYWLGDTAVVIDENGDALDKSGTVIAKGVKEQIPVENNIIRMKDKPFGAWLSKEDFAGNEVLGATCRLEKVMPDGTAVLVERWISSDAPHRLEKELAAGVTYRYWEEAAPEGYGYSEAIEFSVTRDGSITNAHYINEHEKPVLHDKDGYPTGIIAEPDGSYSKGGRPIIIDGEGNAVDSSGEVHALGVRLEIPIAGNRIRMKDAPTRIRILKTDDAGNPLAGAVFQIRRPDNTPVVAQADTNIPSTEHEGVILAGEELTFLSTGTLEGIEITGQLIAGESYHLHEKKPPSGFIGGRNIPFKVPYLNTAAPVQITAVNSVTDGVFMKEDFAGVELPGAVCVLEKTRPDGPAEVIERWVSTGEPKRVLGKLEAGSTYRYREQAAPEGYSYSHAIEFFISGNGVIENAHYVNEENQPVLYDEEGYPTKIIVNPDGTYQEGDTVVYINEAGDAVDDQGILHAKGVGYNLNVSDNTVKMKDAPTKVQIIKTNKDGKPLSGGKFQILDREGNAINAVKDTGIVSTEHAGYIQAGEQLVFEANKNGIDITGQLNAGEEYQLKELDAPDGHHTGEAVVFKVPLYSMKVPIEVQMENAPTTAHFTKTDWTDSREVPGAVCVLKDENGNVIVDQNGEECRWVSTTEPKIFNGILEPGKRYYYCEEKAPDGYGYSEEVSFVVGLDGGIQKIEMQDKPTEALIMKYAAANGSQEEAYPLAGAKLQILHEDGSPVLAIRDSKPAADGTVQFKRGEPLIFYSELAGTKITGLLNADTTYVLRELEAPVGYRRAEDVRFVMSHDGASVKVEMYDPPTHVSIRKVGENGKPISGAFLEIRDPDNWDLLDHWISDGTPHNVTGLLKNGKEYLLVESKAPDGYYKASSMPFMVQEEGITDVQMTDEPVVIKLVKVRTGTMERLSGGRFSIIKKSDGSVAVPEFELNGEMELTRYLNAGETYLMHEIKAPTGYLPSGDMEFTIPYDNPGRVIEVIMENPKKSGGGDGGDPSSPPEIIFKKYDGITMRALPGAEFTIYDSSKRVYKVVTIGKSGQAAVSFAKPGIYTYKETKAPEGYLLDPTEYTIEVRNSNSTVVHVPNYQVPPDVIIHKKDSVTGEPVPGVRFQICDENGTVVYNGVSDQYGQIRFTPPGYGAYAVTETKVPHGYELSDGYITFTITAAGIEGETTFFNHKTDTPGQPEDPGKKAGTIHASYDNNAEGHGEGWFDKDGIWHPFANPAKTGDEYPFIILILIALCGAAGFIYTKREEKRDE